MINCSSKLQKVFPIMRFPNSKFVPCIKIISRWLYANQRCMNRLQADRTARSILQTNLLQRVETLVNILANHVQRFLERTMQMSSWDGIVYQSAFQCWNRCQISLEYGHIFQKCLSEKDSNIHLMIIFPSKFQRFRSKSKISKEWDDQIYHFSPCMLLSLCQNQEIVNYI